MRGRNYDARPSERSFSPAAQQTQLRAASALRKRLPDLLVTFDPTTGAARSVFNATGYLTGEDPGKPGPGTSGGESPLDDLPALGSPGSGLRAAPSVQESPLASGLEFIRAHGDLFGLSEGDLEDYEVTDSVHSRVSTSTHIYLRQLYREIPVYNGQLQINMGRGGRLLSINNAFVPDLARAVNQTSPALGASQAVLEAAKQVGLEGRSLAVGSARGARQETLLEAQSLSLEPIRASLAWLPIRPGEVRLVWNFQIHTLDQGHVYDFTVDAGSGKVWTRFDWVAADSYQAYPHPLESPNHAVPSPPADGREIVSNPADPTASPFEWHDTNGFPGAEFTIHQGNNVHAFDDLNGDQQPPPVEPDCGLGNDCIFPIDLEDDPTAYTSASVSNLFYWTNILHDIQYGYGFDEEAGNFQLNHYGASPTGAGDPVEARTQIGICLNNAFMVTFPDGISPRLLLCLFDFTNPRRDVAFDNGIVVHEFGHGISNRLVGGPSNVSCLANPQQPGEGLSDWWTLAYTALAEETGQTPRGIGTYVIGQPPTGPGIRPLPYSTDDAINPWTYSSIAGMRIPHGVGAVWAQGAWEVYWSLVDQWGFDGNLYDALGGAGNQRMMLYVNEGLKSTACSPAFTDVSGWDHSSHDQQLRR